MVAFGSPETFVGLDHINKILSSDEKPHFDEY